MPCSRAIHGFIATVLLLSFCSADSRMNDYFLSYFTGVLVDITDRALISSTALAGYSNFCGIPSIHHHQLHIADQRCGFHFILPLNDTLTRISFTWATISDALHIRIPLLQPFLAHAHSAMRMQNAGFQCLRFSFRSPLRFIFHYWSLPDIFDLLRGA
jgi:hypothetical protein